MDTVKCSRIYADPDGQSHFGEYEFDLVDGAPPRPPHKVSGLVPSDGFTFFSTVPTYDGGFHPAPARVFHAVLRGRFEVEVTDGERRLFGPGDILLADDTTGLGHRSRSIGSTETLVVLVRMPA